MKQRKIGLLVAALTAAAIAAGAAQASQLIDRNATQVSLESNAKGEAMLTYTVAGKVKHVLAWGAVNAIAPAPGRKQVTFKLDYSAGTASTTAPRTGPTSTAHACPTTGRRSPGLSSPARRRWTARTGRCNPGSARCRTTDYPPPAAQKVWELRLSHWNRQRARAVALDRLVVSQVRPDLRHVHL